jgi:hypothetical protein
MANARSTQRSSASQRASARGAQGSRTTSRTGAWQTVKRHPILAATAAGVLAMGVGAYALIRRNGDGRGSRND